MADIKDPHDQHDHGHDTNPEVSWERKDINIFSVTSFGIGLSISCVVVAFVIWALFDFMASRESAKNAANPPAMMAQRQHVPPEPRLQAEPKVELRELRESEDAILNNFAMLDPNKGTVRIPIDLAIDMVAKKGLPSNPTAAGANGGFRTIPMDANSGRTTEKISQ